jgi:hypothetical protein
MTLYGRFWGYCIKNYDSVSSDNNVNPNCEKLTTDRIKIPDILGVHIDY